MAAARTQLLIWCVEEATEHGNVIDRQEAQARSAADDERSAELHLQASGSFQLPQTEHEVERQECDQDGRRILRRDAESKKEARQQQQRDALARPLRDSWTGAD